MRVRMLLAVTLATACGHSVAKKPKQGEPAVVLTVKGGVEHRVIVELARTEKERNRGLMFRQSLTSGRGMLFLFDSSERRWILDRTLDKKESRVRPTRRKIR